MGQSGGIVSNVDLVALANALPYSPLWLLLGEEHTPQPQ